jgi:hypothetical protein
MKKRWYNHKEESTKDIIFSKHCHIWMTEKEVVVESKPNKWGNFTKQDVFEKDSQGIEMVKKIQDDISEKNNFAYYN